MQDIYIAVTDLTLDGSFVRFWLHYFGLTKRIAYCSRCRVALGFV